MKIKITLLATLLFATAPLEAQTYPVSNGYTILKGFQNSEYNHWVNVVQQKLNEGEKFYVAGEIVNSRGANTIVSQLGSYYNYVYGPAHHEVPVRFGKYQCVWYFNFSPTDGQSSGTVQVCGNF